MTVIWHIFGDRALLQLTQSTPTVPYDKPEGGARGVVVIVVGNGHGHGDTSSNPGRD